MASTTVKFEIHALPDHVVFGEWCDACALPSLVKVPYVMVDGRTLRVILRSSISVCTEHDV